MKTKKTLKFLLAGLAVVLLILVVLAVFFVVVPLTAASGGDPGGPSGNGFQPEVISAKANCDDLDYELEFKTELTSPESAVLELPDGAGAITLDGDGPSLGWESTLGIDAVIARGGDRANRYTYSEPEDQAGEWFQDSLLHAPLAKPDEGPPDVSEVLFCYDREAVAAAEGFGEPREAKIWIVKESTLPGVSQEFQFQASGGLGSFPLAPGESKLFSSPQADTTYAFTETVPTGWSLESIVCVETGEGETSNALAAIEEHRTTVHLDAGEHITCTFTNDPETGQLMVVKELVPEDDPGTFDLKVDGITKKAGASDGDATPMLDVPVGERTIGESACCGTNLENYDVAYRCVKKANLEKVQFANGADELNTVFVDPGDVITCTITNTRKTGDVVIFKETDRSTGTKFDFESNVEPPSFPLGNGESKLFEDLPVGETATFTETVPDGWELSSTNCTEVDPSLLAVLDPSVDVEPVANEVITCTFSNVAVPFITVDKTADPKVVTEPGGEVEYTVRVTSLGTTGPVTLTGLTDDIYGDLTSGTNISITNSTCQDNIKIDDPGNTYQCGFKGMVEGDAGISVTDVVTVTVEDGDQTPAEASDDATVRIVYEPPDTGVDMPVPMVIGGFAAMGLTLLGAGAWVRRRTLMSG